MTKVSIRNINSKIKIPKLIVPKIVGVTNAKIGKVKTNIHGHSVKIT